ncbi:hypothetical protein SRHO_G00248270 [Serrasalmus rhombeus]
MHHLDRSMVTPHPTFNCRYAQAHHLLAVAPAHHTPAYRHHPGEIGAQERYKIPPAIIKNPNQQWPCSESFLHASQIPQNTTQSIYGLTGVQMDSPDRRKVQMHTRYNGAVTPLGGEDRRQLVRRGKLQLPVFLVKVFTQTVRR